MSESLHEHAHSHEHTDEKERGEPRVTLTERAAFHVKRIAKMEGTEGQPLRVGVLPGGCSGFSYDLFFDEEAREGDQLFEFHGVQLRVDPKSLNILQGTEIDFVEGMQGAGFQFKNPQAKSGCGCGKSFNA
jgi:iron-sulfur cluster insertion protein